MTLLRRAHREVYRVYSEDEFFACADHDERSEPAGAVGERRLQRVAGLTVLLAATGAVGGLIAITGLSASAGARRRAGAGLLAATRSFMYPRSARARVWSESSSADGLRGREVHARQMGRRVDAVALARHGESSRRTVPRRPIASEQAAAVAVSEQSTPVATAAPAQSVHVTASAAATSQRSGQAEFGFER
jgi:hypothetical protein